MKKIVILLVIAALAGCGGSKRSSKNRSYSPASVQFAQGPIKDACMQSDRKARSNRLCGCVQAAANQTLSGADQRRAVGIFKDPHSAQETRQSDRRSDEAFWLRYKKFANTAEQVCRAAT